MLDPHNRLLLLDSLRPPEGYQLDHALGTTFSLDLFALLTAPLAFTFFECEDAGGKLLSDPLSLLEAVRRNAERIDLFCQIGRIQAPSGQQRLYAYLENSVHEVRAPKQGGVFHPKVWVLRFVSGEGDVRYRVLCLSRNLTFDRSWDTALILDGELTKRRNAHTKNHPLGNFVESLAGMTTAGITEEKNKKFSQIAREVRRVDFELPEGFSKLSFWPIGIPGHQRNPIEKNHRRLMVVSPFLSNEFLNDTLQGRNGCILVTRPEAAADLPQKTRDEFEKIYVLSREAEQEPDEEDSIVYEETLSGLHAKLFVIDDGWNARIWTGSANATNAAFHRNVEFIVELVGKRSLVGIDKLMEQVKGTTSFADLLLEYRHNEDEVEVAPIEIKLDKILDTVREALSAADFCARIQPSDLANEYILTVEVPFELSQALPDNVTMMVWPVTLRKEHAVPLKQGMAEVLEFGRISVEMITAFYAFDVKAEEEGRQRSTSFVLKLPLDSVPDDRMEQLLRSLLKNRSQVLHLLMLLLADSSSPSEGLTELKKAFGNRKEASYLAGTGLPLLEVLLRTLHQDPKKLDRVNQLVTDLMSTEDGEKLLPDGFDRIWPSIWAAREGIGE